MKALFCECELEWAGDACDDLISSTSSGNSPTWLICKIVNRKDFDDHDCYIWSQTCSRMFANIYQGRFGNGGGMGGSEVEGKGGGDREVQQ